MSDNDQAAVEALMQVKVNTTDYACNGWGSPYGASARAILAAIRAGNVPGIYTCKTDAEMGRYHVAYCEQLKQERDRMAALVAALRARICKIMPERADCECDECLFLRSVDAALVEVGK